jgi:PAS domain S-box-containing protein
MQYGGRTAILNTNRDVTERNRLVHELERSELRFRAIVEHGYDLIVVMDRNGISRYLAGAIGPNLGYTPEELQGTDILALLHPDEREEVRELLGVIADAKEQTRATRNVRVRHRSGAYRWHEVTSVNMLAVSGVEGIVVIAHDVTEQLELAQRLEQERRIDSLGRVAAIVAHEVNNALMSIAPIAEILARKYAADPDIPRLARQITAGVQRGKRVTQQILRFSKPAQPSRMPVVIGDWLAAIEPELNALAGARVRVTTFCTDPLLTIYVDPDQLHQVITNLTVNARDAMQGGGAIDVFAIEAEPGVAEISVHDHGSGIPADVMARLFEPLFTTKANGTGIGLPLSQQIAAAHGGSLSIDSEVGVGTVARVQLPVYRARQPQLSYAT